MVLKAVPNYLSEAIYKAIDKEIAKHPDAQPEREIFYKSLLIYFDEHGVIPDFILSRNMPEDKT